MKLNRVLRVNNVVRQVIHSRVLLKFDAPGSAAFTVTKTDAPVALNQLVVFDVGYASQGALQRFFIGVVLKVTQVDKRRVKIICRELSYAFTYPLPLDLRHVSLREVLTVIYEKTGVVFSLPDAPYVDKKAAKFFNVGSGFQAMASLAAVFKIPDFMYQQQAGVVFVGSWEHSRWKVVPDLLLPVSVFEKQGDENVTVAAITQLRPGIRLNGKRLKSVDLNENKMVVSWKT